MKDQTQKIISLRIYLRINSKNIFTQPKLILFKGSGQSKIIYQIPFLKLENTNKFMIYLQMDDLYSISCAYAAKNISNIYKNNRSIFLSEEDIKHIVELLDHNANIQEKGLGLVTR